MAKGLCCLAQQRGDLGKPIVVVLHHKNGQTSQRCGVCEVVPSCRNPQKRVFAFRFLKNLVCNLPGKAHCEPTQAGIAEYQQQIPIAAAGRETLDYFAPTLAPTARSGMYPYSLPNP